MLTTFSQWLLHISSYGIAYFLLAIEIVFTEVRDIQTQDTFIEKINTTVSGNVIVYILLALGLLSVIYSASIRRWKNNRRIKFCVTKNQTYEAGVQLATNLLPLITIGFNMYIGLAIIIIIWILGIAIIKGGNIHICSVFLLKGYHIFSDDQGQYVLTKMKMEKYNLTIRDSDNGIEVFPICHNVYIVCEN